MIFETRVHGIPCQCEVTDYQKAMPMRITGSGFGDCEPPEPEEFEFNLLDRRGRPAPWLEKHLTVADEIRLLGEYKDACEDEERYAY